MTREEAISVLKETIDPNVEKSFNEWKEWDKEKHLPAVNIAMEALQAEPKHGEWQVDEAECIYGKKYIIENEPYCECSVCGAYIDNLDDGYAFCPRCGAKMDKR